MDDDDWDWKNIEPCMYASNGTKTLMHEWFSEEIRYDYTKVRLHFKLTLSFVQVMVHTLRVKPDHGTSGVFPDGVQPGY